MSAPAIAAVIAFITYSATGHNQNPAIIFTSLTFFILLRLPLMFLRKALVSFLFFFG
jgi:ABC-type multidrug transport system permease subunit